jgi:hypothetical protein
MEEKYEAHAYLKFKKEEDGKDGKDGNNKDAKKFISMLGQLAFEMDLTNMYNEGMRFGCSDLGFTLKLTDFFIANTASFFISNKSEDEVIKQASLFLDAVKEDTIGCIKHTLEVTKNLKF